MIEEAAYDRLLADLYSAVTEPDRLGAVLDSFRALFDASAVALQHRHGTRRGSLSTIPIGSAEWVRDWSWRNPLDMRGTAAGSVVLDHEFIEREKLVATPYYNEFLMPLDIPKVLMLFGPSQDDHGTAMSIMRGMRQPEFDAAEQALARRLSGHVVTAFRSAAMLGWQSWTDLTGSIEQAADAIVLLDAAGMIAHLNPRAERLAAARDGVFVSGGRLYAETGGDTSTLQAAIQRAAAGPEPRVGAMLAIGRSSGEAALVAAVTPLAPRAFDWLTPNPRAMITIADPVERPGRDHIAIGRLFGLSRREAEIADGLANGMTIAEVADQRGITLITARNYLNRVLRKTNVSRQSELVALFTRLALIAPRGGGGDKGG